jgi:uridine kinase
VMRNEWTPQLYYDEGYDYARFVEYLLEPLSPNGSRRCRIANLDSSRDIVLPDVWYEVADDAVVIVDGIFLLRDDLANYWDFVICLDVDVDTMIARAHERDGAWYGSIDAVERRYRQHRLPVYQHYQRLTGAAARAHALIDNRDLSRPKLQRLRHL